MPQNRKHDTPLVEQETGQLSPRGLLDAAVVLRGFSSLLRYCAEAASAMADRSEEMGHEALQLEGSPGAGSLRALNPPSGQEETDNGPGADSTVGADRNDTDNMGDSEPA